MVYTYQFPNVNVVPQTTGSRMAQCFSILESAEELAAEVYNGGLAEREAEACYETIIACEVLLRSYPEKVRREAYDFVVSRNRNRGFWNEPDDLPAW